MGITRLAPHSGGLTRPATELPVRLRRVLARLAAAAPTNIGYPAATADDWRALAPFLGYLLNDVGTPYVDPTYPNHVKDLEREVLAFFAGLFRAPPGCDGYVTSGGSEANLYALWLARTAHPGGVVYHSAAAHYSCGKAAHLLGLTAVTVATAPDGQMDYDDLRRLAAANQHSATIVVATIGTTMTEAVDDVRRIHAALDGAGVTDRYVHSDAALAGIPLAFLNDRPGFDLADGADSISMSGHKFPGTPWPSAVVLTARKHTDHDRQMIAYTGSPDGTISGSRNGHAVVALWLAIHRHGRPGLRQRAHDGRALARYTAQRLAAIGWPSWRNPYALTVMLRALPPEIAARWPLATSDGWSHIICMPGVTRQQIDALIFEVQVWLSAACSTLHASTPARAAAGSRHTRARPGQGLPVRLWDWALSCVLTAMAYRMARVTARARTGTPSARKPTAKAAASESSRR